MKTPKQFLALFALSLGLGLFAGCGSSGGSTHVYGSVSYGSGFYDPWYHGSSHYHSTVIVTPPRPSRPMPSRPMPRGR